MASMWCCPAIGGTAGLKPKIKDREEIKLDSYLQISKGQVEGMNDPFREKLHKKRS